MAITFLIESLELASQPDLPQPSPPLQEGETSGLALMSEAMGIEDEDGLPYSERLCLIGLRYELVVIIGFRNRV